MQTEDMRLKDILKKCPSKTIQIFYKDDFYTTYIFIDGFPHIKSDTNKLAYHQYESLVRFSLKTAKYNIQEFRHTVYDLYTLEKEASPYNWSHYLDIMNDEFVKPVCSMYKKKDCLYAAFYDFNDQFIYYLCFIDDDILSNLYAFLTEINCFDVLIDDLQLEKTLLNMGMNVVYIKEKIYVSCNVKEEEFKRVIGLLIKHLNIDDPKIKKHERKCLMQIDYKTLHNLDFIEIIKLIKPETMQGRRLLNQVVRQPLTELLEICKRQEYVDALYNFNPVCLKGFPDLIKFSRRLLKIKVTDVVVIYKAINKLVSILDNLMLLSDTYPVLNDFASPLADLSTSFQQLKSEIEKVINLEEHTINRDLNQNLTEIENEIDKINEVITFEYNRVLEISNKIKLQKKPNCVVTFKIPRSEYGILEKNNFVEQSVLKSGIVFTTNRLENLNDKLEYEINEYTAEERKILDNLLIFMNNYSNSFEIVNYIVSMIDLFHSFSKLRDLGFTRPIIGDEYNMKGIYHPLVQGCIKNNFELSGDKKFCVITGPNMGGKSTFIKQCAVISILAQIGSLVPADNSTVPLISGIYVRIGANDLASKGMSTFMVEMNDVARICKNASPNSLIIIDELGRGTSALDGLCLALSIKEFLLKKRCFTLFATHFPEICGSDVLNLRMTCNITGDLTMLYKIEEGVCDVSLGIEVAESVGFPVEVIEMAKKYIQ